MVGLPRCSFCGRILSRDFLRYRLSPDYPYCLAGKELRGVIKGLIGRCGAILPDLLDHCVYTMLRELDRQSGSVHELKETVRGDLALK